MERPNSPIAIAAVRTKTSRAQADAADPLSSAWVSANAGTGKTHVLTMRVLRLLLAGTKPERILCLTYTKAAAAEMSKRVFGELAKWVTAPSDTLDKILQDLTGIKQEPAEIERARTLFTRAIETPGGLKVQTIHAFAERLLQRFPLEAGVPPGFKILDDDKTRELQRKAIDATLEEATRDPAKPLGLALKKTIRYASDSNFDELLAKAIHVRDWLEAAARFDLGSSHDDFAAAEKYLRKLFNVRTGTTADSLDTERASVLPETDLRALKDLTASGTKTDVVNSEALSQALAQRAPKERAGHLARYFLTAGGEKRSALMTKGLGEQSPDLLSLAERAQLAFCKLEDEAKAASLVDATGALYRLAGAVLQRYSDSKAAAGALDFDDLIRHTTDLLSTASSAEWVLYKLDGGLDHILVDEAQDTSPAQWQIISALAQEFFSGAGQRDNVRTVFAVGDEKQSIYSFQGAEPEQFARMGQHFASLAETAKVHWRRVPLNLSFRTVQPVLDAVDQVFRDSKKTPGLTAEALTIEHIASRFGQSGTIEIWPTEVSGDTSAADPWKPLADSSERAPANRLAERIAATIGDWLDKKEMLASEGRPIRAGDILILVRKRHPFAVPMVAALKTRGIAVAGSDRMALTEQIAVEDLLALGDFLTLPEDDLALANVLKGPLFNYSDDDLLVIAHGRKGSLWKAFLAHADTAARFKPAAESLKRWRAKADFTPPFEFFSNLLDRDGGRTKMLERLGPEAADAVDEFLDIALNYDDRAPPSLTGFLADLRSASRDVKRDMEHGRDEVRVMTVHGAKGLEAPIVFLPDTCTTASGNSPGTRLISLPHVERPKGVTDPVVWPVKGTSKLEVIRAAQAAHEARATEERNRLLYVAMTRARDQLYVSGFEGKKGRTRGCWYDLISDALTPHLSAADTASGKVLRLVSPQAADIEKERQTVASALAAQTLPAFALQRVATEPQLSVPLAPSRLEPYAPDSEGEPTPNPKPDPAAVTDRPSPLALASGNRFLRGTLTHALLEHLPSIPENLRASAAAAFVEKRGAGLTTAARKSIVKETLAILTDPVFKPLFNSDSRAEVPISALLPRPSGKGPALRLSGQIDRLAVTAKDVLIVDYKTNRPPPSRPQDVAPAYLYQIAAYVLALNEIYPGRSIRAALLWTDGPHLMEIPAPQLQNYVKRLWDLDTASLDAS